MVETGIESLTIRLLGGFEVTVGKRLIGDGEWSSRKAGSLVKLLALAPGHRLHREQVMDALWPDLGPRAASGNLRKALHFARHTVASTASAAAHPYLQTRGEFLLLSSPGPLWVDVGAFREASDKVRRSSDPAAYEQAIALYAGDLLPDDRYEEWTLAPREELRNTYLLLLAEAARLDEAGGNLRAAIETLQKALELEPLNERTYADLMRLHALVGEGRQALRLYRLLSERLRRELDVEPREATSQLYREIQAGRFPPGAGEERPQIAPPTRRHNLPTQLTSFVGRDREIAHVERLLDGARLLTLTGVGGSGKTRLALKVAGRLVDNYPDGAWLVELGGLSDPGLVAQAVASALGARDQPGRALLETVADNLRARRLLLVLDNCEHLVRACAELAEMLLRACPDLTILATSREALNIRGETTWPVPSLSVPDLYNISSMSEATASNLARYEAAQLFAERAASALPAFQLGGRNASAVAQICRRLDGIPLAIELAAARVRVLSAEQIAERLHDSFHLLTGGSRTELPRHQTLRAAVDWSYELLTLKERALFARLSVFAGGFTLEAVEAVGAGDPIEQGEVLDLLSHLIDKSLVVVTAEPEAGEAVRYRLLETLRQYGRERLAADGEEGKVVSRHAHYYVILCARADPQLHGPDQIEWLDRLNIELDNLRVALDWCLAHDAQAGMLLAGSIPRFWDIRGYLTEGRRRLDGLLEVAPEPTALRAKALCASGHLASRQGDNARGVGLMQHGLAIYEELGDQMGIASALERLGIATSLLGDDKLGVSYLERSITIFRRIGYKAGLGWTLVSMGMQARTVGDYERADSALNECYELVREVGDLHGIAYALNNLGQLARVNGDFDAAWELIQESLDLSRTMNNKPLVCWALECLATIARMRGDYEQSREPLVGSLEVAREIGVYRHLSRCIYSFALLAVHYGAYEPAVRLFAAALNLHPNIRLSLDADEIVEWDQAADTAREAVPEETFTRAWAEGKALTWDRAHDLCLEVMPTVALPSD